MDEPRTSQATPIPGPAEPPRSSRADSPNWAVRAEGIKVRYRNGALGVLDVSFNVGQAEVVALFGANGAGKTSTVRAVGGFVRTERASVIEGRVSVFGKDVTNCEPHVVCRHGVAFVPERRKVFTNLSVQENLAALGVLPPRATRARVYAEIYELFPMLWEYRTRQAGRLSGGQQQMLAIARALLSEPKVLIVDEMTLGLHPSMHEPLFDVVKTIASRGTSVVIVDESAGFSLEVADYCFVLGGGLVADEGPPENFRDRHLLVAGYVDADAATT